MVKLLSVLVSTISNTQLFLLKKYANAKATHIFFSKNISVYARGKRERQKEIESDIQSDRMAS